MRIVRTVIAALTFATLPVAGLAQGKFDVPEGCIAMATVHKTMCHVTTVMDCGARKVAVTFADGAPLVIHDYTPEWELIEFRYANEQVAQMTAVPGTGTNMDLTTAIETGTVEENGEFLFSTNVIKERKYVLDGHIDFTGETVDLSGVPFHKGRIFRVFELKPGNGGLDFEIDVYVAKDRDLVFEASWQRSVFGNNVETFDQTPMEIHFQGDAGFLATKPEAGCE